MTCCHYAPWELRDFEQWANWRREPARNGRWTKTPYIAAPTLMRASSTNPDTWRSEGLARRYVAENHMNGSGFMLSDRDPFVAFDLDDCVDEVGYIHPAALEIVKEIGTYTEFSPSWRGLRGWGIGSLNGIGMKLMGDWGGLAEFYGTKRFMTVTGEQMHGAPRE